MSRLPNRENLRRPKTTQGREVQNAKALTSPRPPDQSICVAVAAAAAAAAAAEENERRRDGENRMNLTRHPPSGS